MTRSDSGNSQGVNNILHNLRSVFSLSLGIITLNCRSKWGTVPSAAKHKTFQKPPLYTRNFRVPTLPPGTVDFGQSPDPASTRQQNPVSWSGPAPPKSWRSPLQTRDRDTPQWRTEALGIVALYLGNFPVGNTVPSLSLLCLQVILSSCVDSKEFREQIVPFIPNHLRRDLIRHCAIHSPLPAWKLDALLESDGHVDGEIMVVGRTASPSLRKDHLQRIADTSLHHSADWEVDDQPFRPLRTLVFLTSSPAHTILLAIPPTLTNLALIDVPSPQPLHRLPKLCPLLVLLDLSYNSWLKDPSVEGYGSFERIDWLRWGHLKILGLRDCYATRELLQRIEEGKCGGLSIIH
jgi:hypothetical protein